MKDKPPTPTNKALMPLFLISLVVFIVLMILATFWQSWNLGENMIPLALIAMVTGGLSFVGMILGFVNLKKAKGAKYYIALVGNCLILLVIFSTMFMGFFMAFDS